MGKILATFPAQADTIQTVTLDEVQYRVRLYWRDRLAAWYLDLSLLDGTALALGRRVSTQWSPIANIKRAGMPPGYLLVKGPAEYERAQLGGDLEIVYYSANEVTRATAETFGITVDL